ncbi:hypothetical protein BV898_07515 [Hypsibius exemplaris]|uniref:Uncharacterized protein n=1 Tax=Hypsibius exemplaris TaxID=2072580 RepID=A0A1W0WTI0_HYPEX|nr:hypothetical protein BV898_07515 [Hypsibius exemplaris]
MRKRQIGMKGQNCSYPFDSVTHSDSKPKNADMVLHFMPTQNTPDQIQFMGTIALTLLIDLIVLPIIQEEQPHLSTTKDPVTKTVHHVKLDPDEKYLEEKEVASLISKNELETVKQRGGHRDDETDRVQNDGSTNPDSQSSVKKLSRSSAAAGAALSSRHSPIITD